MKSYIKPITLPASTDKRTTYAFIDFSPSIKLSIILELALKNAVPFFRNNTRNNVRKPSDPVRSERRLCLWKQNRNHMLNHLGIISSCVIPSNVISFSPGTSTGKSFVPVIETA